MEKGVANNSTGQLGTARCSKLERDAAFNFATFLYSEWRKNQKDEIIKVDKTNFDNNESTNNN
jgi:hypothetical protein